ncbi:MAG: hypothetical protein M1819_003231 [Sarea resinae]|nr:MAG: hypothetical protein M1819_003231 [Sarea resinae]
MATDAAFERESGSNYSDTAYRRSWASPTASRMVDSSEDGYFPRMPASFPVENHGRNRAHTIASGQGWGKAVYEVVGEVAGKVWEFCRSSAFMGFYAGGGKGYHLNQPHSFQESGVPSWQGLDHDTSLEREMSLDSTPVPGGYPSERQIVEQAQQDTASPRPAKRLQTGKGTGGIRANWVIVPVASTPVSREASPSRIPLRKAPAVSPPKRVAASPRRAVTSRASRRPGLGSPRTSYVSQASQPGQLSGKQASFASPRSPATSAPSRPTTPASLEAKRFAAQRRREEKEADASIKKLNQQLKAMIREGKEALGSTIEIEDDFSNASLAKDYEMDMEMEDEGFSEAMHMGYDRMPY